MCRAAAVAIGHLLAVRSRPVFVPSSPTNTPYYHIQRHRYSYSFLARRIRRDWEELGEGWRSPTNFVENFVENFAPSPIVHALDLCRPAHRDGSPSRSLFGSRGLSPSRFVQK
jgi:hypothetical protein